jgi:hypothetical protein
MRSDGRFLIAAVLLHAAAMAAASRAPLPPAPERHPDAPLDTIDVAVLPSPLAEPAPDVAPPGIAGLPVPEPVRGGARPPEEPRTGALRTAPVGQPSPPSPRDGFDPVPDERAGGTSVLGVDGPALWSIPGVLPPGASPSPAPTRPPAQRALDRNLAGHLLHDALERRDKQIGIDVPAAGTVAVAVADAVRSSPTPNVARATFVVRLDGAGRVRDVRVLGVTDGDAGAWQAVARAAASQLASRALAMPGAYARGAVVTVEVTSVVQFPSGTKSARAKKLLHEEGAPTHVGVEDGALTASRSFDLSDIDAHETRVVSTRFTVQPAP